MSLVIFIKAASINCFLSGKGFIWNSIEQNIERGVGWIEIHYPFESKIYCLFVILLNFYSNWSESVAAAKLKSKQAMYKLTKTLRILPSFNRVVREFFNYEKEIYIYLILFM